MTEVFYPTLDVPNVQTLQLVIVQGSSVETESEDTVHRLEVLDPRALLFRQINTAKNGKYQLRRPTLPIPSAVRFSLTFTISMARKRTMRVFSLCLLRSVSEQ